MKPSVLSELNKIVASRGQHSAREARELLLKAEERLREYAAQLDRYNEDVESIINLLTG